MMIYDNGIEMIIVLKYNYDDCVVDIIVIIALKIMISIKWTLWYKNLSNVPK